MENVKKSSGRLAKFGDSAIGRLMKSGLGSIGKGGKSIRTKLLVAFLVLALIPLIVVGIVTLTASSNALMSKAFDNLEAVRANKTLAIENFLYRSESDMNILLETVKTLRQEAFDQLTAVRTIKKGQIEDYFTARLSDIRALSTNPVVAEGLSAFKKVTGKIGGSEWQAVERTYGPWMAKFIEEYGYIDLFLISDSGQVLYTVEKASDLGQDLKSGKLKDSPAGKAFNRGLTTPTVQDFGVYEPSGDAPAAFIAAPVKVGGETTGVAMIQIPIQQINAIMQERAGLGETGETYLVATDKLFRSDSRLVEDSTILDPTYLVNTEAVNLALAGKTGEKIIRNFRGIPVLSAYAPLEIPGVNWTIIADISVEESFAPKVVHEVEDFFTTYKENYGYYDLYLINPDGYLFYSVEHQPDYKTNMLTGLYKDTNLGRLVAEVLETKKIRVSRF
jgi:methyl-accepting chemotaxis protein